MFTCIRCSLTNSEVEIKEPDVDDWCLVDPSEGCENETLSTSQVEDVANYLAGNGSFDYQTFAARYVLVAAFQTCSRANGTFSGTGLMR